jgi:TFIIF-interacting CTD phosphatase-like protein
MDIKKKDKNFVLDLDETLISAEPTEDYDYKKYDNKIKKFKEKPMFMDDYYIIIQRPGLQKFLDFLFQNFNVSIWTAASKDYALYIIENIILGGHPERKLDYIFFSYHCNISKKLKKGSKDLSMLWDVYQIEGYNNKNTFILDDLDEVFEIQNDNCIIADQFKFVKKNSENDNFLKQLIPKIKKYVLKKETNIKEINI